MSTLRIILLLKIQPYRSPQQLMDQINSSWQTPDPGLIRAAETNGSDIDSGNITDLEANTSNEDESSFFKNSLSIMKQSTSRLKHIKNTLTSYSKF